MTRQIFKRSHFYPRDVVTFIPIIVLTINREIKTAISAISGSVTATNEKETAGMVLRRLDILIYAHNGRGLGHASRSTGQTRCAI